MEGVERLLKGLPLFEGFSPAQLHSLVAKSRLDTFAPREAIIRFGQPGRYLVVIVDGVAEVVITEEDGERKQVALRKQGDFLGEISLLTGEPTTADVIALEKCEALLIPQETFSAFLAVNPAALRVMAKTITERLRWRELDEGAQTRVQGAWQSVPDPYGLNLSVATPMKILTLNCSDESIKFAYFDTVQDTRNFQGVVDGIGKGHSTLAYRENGNTKSRAVGGLDHAQALDAIVELLTGDGGVIGGLYDLDAIGHKVTHGGDRYGSAVIVDDQVLAHIEQCASFAPLHNPANLVGIRASLQIAPKVLQVAIFDTGFHQKMPVQAYLDGLPYEFFEQDHLRRYGSHGISHQYAALQAAAHLKRNFRELKIITCYLDDEASMCAIDHGRSVDTTAGLSPLGGLIMSTRSGDLDPSIVLHLMREKGLSVDQVQELLNQQSGLRGLSGISGDFRELEDAANRGDHRSIVAIQAFCYRVRKCIGSYVSAMGELDALVFTGHIAEGSAWVRSLACQGLSSMSIAIDEIRNKTILPRPTEATEITDESSQVSVLVIPADEARMIARETVRALGYQNVARTIERQEKREIPVEVSAHHVHLCEKDVEALFGAGHQLSRRSDLSQPGQYACEETVNLVGPRGRVDRVRILGPTRSQTQLEIAMTEEFKLGVKAPIRASGDLDGSPGITLEGPKGIIDLPRGVICSVRHIHMSPEDVLTFGLKDRDICMIRVEGERTLIFGDVLVRVNPDYRLAMHIDTDEANAASIRTGMLGYLVGVQDRR